MNNAELNERQREAVLYLDGPCLVLAGAGSGKTRVIIKKIQHLISSGFSPNCIAAITFTNKSAQEMADRLTVEGKKTGRGERPFIGTFHAMGLQILRQESQSIGFKPQFSVIDSSDSVHTLQEILETADTKIIRSVKNQISLWKNALLDPESALISARTSSEQLAASAYQKYTSTLTAYQSVDFDDLISLPNRIFSEHPDILQRWREKFRYLLVDEYQDTNTCQYDLLKKLTGPREAFTVVGDDEQSIYGWRGADIKNLSQIKEDFPKLYVIKLEQNYRSSQSILTAANNLIAHNNRIYPKSLWSELGVGDEVQISSCEDEEAEAELVATHIKTSKFFRRGQFSDYAVLYRSNYQARVIEQAFRKEKIPYVLSGGQSFFERTEIRDIIAYLRLLVNEEDGAAFIRAATTPKRGIGQITLKSLGNYAAKRQISMFEALFENGIETYISTRQLAPLQTFGKFINCIAYRAAKEPTHQVLDDLLQAIEYEAYLNQTYDPKTAEKRWKNVSDFCDWLKKRAEAEDYTFLKTAQTVSILSQLDRQESDLESVFLSTIHAAKGLEFPHVLIVGSEEGLLPHLQNERNGVRPEQLADKECLQENQEDPSLNLDLKASNEKERVEEERRLMYVAVTRAQKSLHLTWCKKRGVKLKSKQNPSRFIEEMKLSSDTQSQPTSQEKGLEMLASLKALLKV